MNTKEFVAFFKKRHITTSSFISGIILMLVDAFIVMFVFGMSFFIVNAIDHSLITFKSFVNYWVYLPAFIAVFYAIKLYPGIMIPPGDEIRRFATSSFFCFTGIALSIAIETDDRAAICFALILSIPIATIMLSVGREIARKIICKSKFWGIPAIIYTKNNNYKIIVDRLISRKDFGYLPIAIIDLKKSPESYTSENSYQNIPIFSNNIDIQNTIKSLKIKVAIIIDSDDISIDSEAYLPILNYYRYIIKIPKKQSIDSLAVSVRDFGGIFGFSSTHNLTKPLNLFIKRLIDILVLLIFLPFYLPLILIIAFIVKISSPGPIFFGHKRIGKNGKEIKTWKFRSMVNNAQEILPELLSKNPELKEEWDKNQKLENDPRVTKIGKFLRKTSLDELPQLWNIFIGQMSLVGPRPVTKPELEKYRNYAEYVNSVTPGLSGMWQISGRSDTGYEERITLDMYYIQNWSVWLDIWILIKTVSVVFKGKGAY